MLGFEAEMDLKIDAKRNKKSLNLEVAEKITKMRQNGCQMGSRKLPKLKKIDTKNKSETELAFETPKGPLGASKP